MNRILYSVEDYLITYFRLKVIIKDRVLKRSMVDKRYKRENVKKPKQVTIIADQIMSATLYLRDS